MDGTTLGISQALCKALYRVHTAHLRGHDPAEHIAKLASVNPDRIKIPDIDEGRRLRASLRARRSGWVTPHPSPAGGGAGA
ncbi:hypothetical protein [Streptomyces anulatus]|uniref:hypothetical protein n=1 Tax=Streptomyces anulatus TaxID=1892 RepID=UPI0033245503